MIIGNCRVFLLLMKIRPTVWGIVFSGLAVIFGAFGAHALADRLQPEELEGFKTGVQYQMYHGLALILAGIMLKNKPSANLSNAAICFILGTFFFSGSLYLITIGKISHFDFKWVGPITPIGGLAFTTGWALMLYHYITKR
jgi:uncharacterized membrane protein YgdD (TMEM256/DUF423 family)